MKGYEEEKNKVVEAFRRVQRSYNAQVFNERKVEFFAYIDSVFKVNAIAAKVKNYFKVNWFCSRWVLSWVDYGFPKRFNRDLVNTNNICEAAFKVFDTVFLNSTKNRRIDHLVLIILTHLFLYYEQVNAMRNESPKRIEEFVTKRVHAGLDLWEENKVISL